MKYNYLDWDRLNIYFNSSELTSAFQILIPMYWGSMNIEINILTGVYS